MFDNKQHKDHHVHRNVGSPIELDRNHTKRCPWITLGWRYPEEIECLASFLSLESAEIIAGVKPANLFRIPGRKQPCGRNLAQISRKHGELLFDKSPLQVMELNRRKNSPLLLVYSPCLMEQHLDRAEVRSFLAGRGYRMGDDAWRSALLHLCSRCVEGQIPHEIGIFLGYPVKDVAGFVGLHSLPVTCQRLWKIYGPPQKSLLLAERFENARAQIRDSLLQGVSPQAVLSCNHRLAA